MNRLLPVSLLAVMTALALRADSPAPLAAPVGETASSEPAPREHAFSSETSARITHGLPVYLRAPSTTDTPAPDLRASAPPRNTIPRLPAHLLATPTTSSVSASLQLEPPPEGVLRLPRYEVRDRKQSALKRRELLTPEAKIDLQFKQHPGLKIGNLFGLNRGIAAFMAAEEDDHERALEMGELLSFQQFADAHPAHESNDDTVAPTTLPVSSTTAPTPSTD